jgi:hypothetical protein
MASIVYPLILFIFIFGAATTFINETGLYSAKLPESGIVSNTDQANEFNDALTKSSKDSGLNAYEQMYLMGKCVFGGIFAIFTLGPLLDSYGVPLGMQGFLLSPLGIVLVFWLIEMWLGRPAE